MTDICSIYNIRGDNGKYCLEDIINNIMGSKNANGAINVVTDKTFDKKHNTHFVTADKFVSLLENGRKPGYKKAYKEFISNGSDLGIGIPYSVKKKLNLIKKATVNVNAVMENIIDVENNYFSFGGVNITTIQLDNGEIWFKGNDVAKILEYSNIQQALRINVREKNRKSLTDLPLSENWDKTLFYSLKENQKGGAMIQHPPCNISLSFDYNLQDTFINEPGLYELILKSKKEEALKFQDWVFEEVLPSIRKTGKYKMSSIKNITPLPELLYDLTAYADKACIYILKVKGNLYKYGKSEGIVKRTLDDHYRDYDYDKIVLIEDVNNMSIATRVETNMKIYFKQQKINRFYNTETKEISTKRSLGDKTELFLTDDLNSVIAVVKRYAHEEKKMYHFRFHPEVLIEMEKTKQITAKADVELEFEKTKQLELKFKMNSIDHFPPQIEDKIEETPKAEALTIGTNFPIQEEKPIVEADIPVQEEKPMTEVLTIETNIPIQEEKPMTEVLTTEADIPVQEEKPKSKPKIILKKKEVKLPKRASENPCVDCGCVISRRSVRCVQCNKTYLYQRNIDQSGRPTYDQLMEDKKTMSAVGIAQKYHVSDTTIREWIAGYEKKNPNLVKPKIEVEVSKALTEKCLDCDELIYKTSTRCKACAAKKKFTDSVRETSRPSYQTLLKDLETMTTVNVGKKYNRSDNCIRKWLRKYKQFGLTDI